MLRADRVVPERVGLVLREREQLPGPRSERQLRGRALGAPAGRALPGARRVTAPTERDQRQGPHLLDHDVQRVQDAKRHAVLHAQQAEQDVFRADRPAAERERLSQGELERLLGTGGEGDLAGRGLIAPPDDADDLVARLLDREIERVEHASSGARAFAQQPEQQVLRADGVVPERAGLDLREDDDLARALCETLEHNALRRRRSGEIHGRAVSP